MFTAPDRWSGWVWWGSGWGLVALGAALLVWALLWGRARGRLRCPRCWYDMGGGGRVCPECGRRVKSERALKKTRRRWGWACVGAAALLTGMELSRVATRTWETSTRFVPTWALMLLAGRDYSDGVTAECTSALRRRGVAGWQRALVEWRLLDPGEGGPRGLVRTRAVWPVGEAPVLRLIGGEGLLPVLGEAWTVPVGGSDGGGDDGVGFVVDPARYGPDGATSYERPDPDDEVTLPVRGPGRYREVATVSVFSGGWRIARWRVDVAYEVGGTLDDAVRPVDSQELRAAVLGALRARQDVGGVFVVWAAVPRGASGHMPLALDVIVDGKAVAHGEVVAYVQVVAGREGVLGPHAIGCGSADPAAYAREKVRVRVRGDQRAALRAFDTEYWSGTVELSLAELLDAAR